MLFQTQSTLAPATISISALASGKWSYVLHRLGEDFFFDVKHQEAKFGLTMSIANVCHLIPAFFEIVCKTCPVEKTLPMFLALFDKLAINAKNRDSLEFIQPPPKFKVLRLKDGCIKLVYTEENLGRDRFRSYLSRKNTVNLDICQFDFFLTWSLLQYLGQHSWTNDIIVAMYSCYKICIEHGVKTGLEFKF